MASYGNVVLLCVRDSVNRIGDVALMYIITFLAFTIQSITMTIVQFTELRVSLTVVSFMEYLLVKYFSTFYFPHNISCSS